MKKAAKVLVFTEVDEKYYESEGTNYAITSNDSEYVFKKLRKKTWSVLSKVTGKQFFEGAKRGDCELWVEKKTGKKIKFSRS
jgi:hypothetical protein